MARRARRIAEHAAPRVEVSVVHRPQDPRGYARLWRRLLLSRRPDAVCIYDVNPREVLPGLLARVRGVPVILEIGDIAGDMLEHWNTPAPRVRYRKVVEHAAWRGASALTVRGPAFIPILRERGVRRPVHVVPEGVDRDAFRPLDPAPGRALLGLRDGERAVGVVGSIVWNPATATAYGWELVEALPRLPGDWRVVLVGEGDGLEPLRAGAESLGAGDRLITPGRLPHERIPDVLAALDAVTWTQEPAYGLGRTTLKLPEYLACGKYVLAGDAPMAVELIRDNGEVLRYAGGRDLGYARAMADAISRLPPREELDRLGAAGIERSAPFGWDEVAARFCEVVESVGHQLG